MNYEIDAPEPTIEFNKGMSPSEKLALKAKEIEKARDAERISELDKTRERYNEWVKELQDLDPVSNPERSIDMGIRLGAKADNAMDIFELGMAASTGGVGVSTVVDFATEQVMETAAIKAVQSGRENEREEPSFKQEVDPFAPPSIRNRNRRN